MIIKYEKSLSYLFLNFSGTMQKLSKFVCDNPFQEINICLAQTIGNDLVKTNEYVFSKEKFSLFDVQKKLFLRILDYLTEFDDYHKFEIFSSMKLNFRTVELILLNTNHSISDQFLSYLRTEILPLLDIQLDGVELFFEFSSTGRFEIREGYKISLIFSMHWLK